MGVKVVDASVCTKWLLPEQGAAEASSLLRMGDRLIAPDLVNIEVIGAVLRRNRERTLSDEQVGEILTSWGDMLADGSLSLTSNAEVFDRAVSISLKLRHPLKDCLYLALAEQEDADLVTADKQLHERGRTFYTRITLLGRGA